MRKDKENTKETSTAFKEDALSRISKNSLL